MASILRQLSDADLVAIHHMIRRDAHTDLDIAREAERRLGKAVSSSPEGAANVVYRYRKSKAYGTWLREYKAQFSQMEASLAEQRQRFEMLLNAVRGAPGSGFENVSDVVLADLLTAAASMPVEEKIEAFGRGGWVKNLVAAVQKQAQVNATVLAKKAEDVAGDSTISEIERRRRIREIFGKGDA